MVSKIVGKLTFEILTGRITTDSYSTTIKKLTFLQESSLVQLASCRAIAGMRHVEAGIEHFLSALETGNVFTRQPSLELLIWLFGRKQIPKALEMANFRQGEPLLLIVALGKGSSKARQVEKILKKLNFIVDKQLLWELGKNRQELMALYGINKREIGALADLENPLEDLVIEKISMVALEG
ncbi:MAG TPA: hypothetical protein HA254_04045 [Candidatus Diapherotrites archaeon]|uniref:Uncharacterized protein n=1 Tax=Candidatus Iainarchaeum sp. TaxID=3101447 RepID=A0A7J4J3K6_9ARCH|nr:hypothetical protein [Candidatus Diapherotrites archaeon]